MTVRAMFHICMELWGIFICLICAGGIFIATPQKTRRTRIKILMQIACMLLLGTDALSWYFRVDADETAYYMVRISNFSVFCINYIFMSFFATYVWLTVSKHQHRKPAALRAVYALSVIGILLLIITQFTGLFYYFDDHNLYHRGNFYLLSQAIAVLGIALCLFMLISYRKNLDRIIFLSMMSFFVLPVLATIYQALAYSFSLQCLAIVISTQIMFVMDTVEMNMRFHSQQAAYEKARYEAEHDGMTGLLNKEAGWKHMRKYFDRMDSKPSTTHTDTRSAISGSARSHPSFGTSTGKMTLSADMAVTNSWRLFATPPANRCLKPRWACSSNSWHAPRNSTGKTCIAV